jgi:hypothetical protein
MKDTLERGLEDREKKVVFRFHKTTHFKCLSHIYGYEVYYHRRTIKNSN